ncbi:MAG: hydroxypyruvate isomerase [Rubrivivax sp.]|nr:hydroxypyruvate isomerase [Rubrivivax sp.]
MPRFAANLSTLFTEVPFLDRFALAREAGFEAVEVQFPYAWAAAEIRERLAAAHLQLVLHNLPAGDWSAGERGIACLPDRRDDFRAGVQQGIDYALALGAPQLNALAGVTPSGADEAAEAEMHATMVDNLRFAAAACAKAGIELLVEAINTHDVPGSRLSRSAQALALIDEVGASNLRLQYDVYHMQRMEGELAATLQRALPRIGHVQVADNPGRHEPGSGEINFPFLFSWLDRIGYAGWVGCEYVPAAGTRAGLAWRERLLA